MIYYIFMLLEVLLCEDQLNNIHEYTPVLNICTASICLCYQSNVNVNINLLLKGARKIGIIFKTKDHEISCII